MPEKTKSKAKEIIEILDYEEVEEVLRWLEDIVDRVENANVSEQGFVLALTTFYITTFTTFLKQFGFEKTFKVISIAFQLTKKAEVL